MGRTRKPTFSLFVTGPIAEFLARIESTNGQVYTPDLDEWVHGGSPRECEERAAALEEKMLSNIKPLEVNPCLQQGGRKPGFAKPKVKVMRTPSPGRDEKGRFVKQ